METESKKSFLINLFFYLSITLIVLISARFLFKYFLPFIIAGLVAYFVQKPSAVISRKTGLQKNLIAAIMSAMLFVGLSALCFILFYSIANGVKSSFSGISEIISNIAELFTLLRLKLHEVFNEISPELSVTLGEMTADMIKNITERLTAFFSSFAASVAKGLPSFLFSFIVCLVASCYIAKDYNILVRFFRNLFGESVYTNTLKVKDIFTNSVLKMLKGYALILLLTFAELTVGFAFLRIKNAVIIALIVSIIDLLPVLGTGTVLIPWGIAELIRGNAVGFGIILLYVFITVVRNFAEPKVIGNQIGINPLFTLVAMFAGLKIAGFFGLLIFPITLIVVIKYYKEN